MNDRLQSQRPEGIETRLMPVTTVDAKARTVTVVFSTGAPVRRRDWRTGQPYIEELLVTPEAVDLTRLRAGAPVLRVHSQFDLADVLGVVESAEVKRGEASAVLRFSERDDVAPVFADVAGGILRNVSVGYAIDAVEVVAPNEKQPLEVRRVTKWTPYEISLVPIGADAAAGVRSAEFNPSRTSRKEPAMTDEATTTEPAAQDRNAVRAERRRVEFIRDAARRHNLGETFARALIDDDACDLNEARRRLFDELSRRTEASAGRSAAFLGEDGISDDDGADPRLRRMAEALHARHGGPAPAAQARPYLRMRLVDMARELLEARGHRTTMLTNDKLVERAMTTSDFPILLQGTGERILRAAYGSYDGGIRQICRQSTARDFRAKTKVQLGEAPALEKVNEHGAFTYGPMAEAKETYALATYGKIVPLSRQALVNDDLGAFADMLGRLGRAAAEFEAQQLVALLTQNSGAGPTMGDSVELFHSTHGNLAGSGAAIDVTTLGAARAAMRLQKGLDAKTPIDARPKFLLVPAALETRAEQYLTTLAANAASSANPFSGQLTLVTDPRLDAISATAWYVAADPAIVETIEYAYLEEQPGPQLLTREGWSVDGTEFKVRLDWGAAVIDFRGLYRNPGS
jgi:hypothetical protein